MTDTLDAELLLLEYLQRWPLLSEEEARRELGIGVPDDVDE